MPSYFLTTPRLGFRRWRIDDLSLAAQLWGDAEVTRYIDARNDLNRDEIRDKLLHEIQTQQAHGIQYWPIFDLRDTTFVGCCGLRPYKGSKAIREIGFHICRRFWGQGLAFEAASATVAFAFQRLGLKALFAGHHPDNRASMHLLIKLGFVRTQDEYYEPTGLDHPSYLLEKDVLVADDGRDPQGDDN